MANVASVLRNEFTRIGRRKIRRELVSVKRASTRHRSDIAALKRQIAALQRLVAQLSRRKASVPPAAEDSSAAVRFVAEGLRSFRARFSLSAADIGKLIGASQQSVYNWEAKTSKPRREHVAALNALRKLGKRELHARLSAARTRSRTRSGRN